MKLNRQAIQRMVDSGQLNIGGRKSGGGSGAGGGGGVSATWVDDNYISKAFFARLFTIHSDTVTQQDPHGEVVEPNDAETTIDNIEASVDFWSVGNVSALGPAGSGGGGGGVTLNEPLASINSANLGTPTSNGQVIMWNAALSKWVYGIPSGGSSLTMQTVWQNLAASTTEQIALTHLTTALTGYVKTADLPTLTIGKADKLSTARNLWGQSFDGSAEVKGTLEHVTNIQLQELSANTGAQIKFFYGGANSITSYIHENQSGSLSINGQIFVTNNGNVGIGGSPSGSKLNISGDAKASNLESAGYVKATGYLSAGTSVTAGTTLNAGTNVIAGAADGTFIQIGNIRIGYDQTNDALEVYKLSGSSHASANLYARGNVSALGPAGSGGGGGVSLNEPLSSINSKNLGTPTTTGTILIWRSTGGWQYTQQSGLTMDTVWNQLSNPTNQQINISHLQNALSGYSTSDTKNTTGIYQSTSKLFLIGCEAVGTTADAYGVTKTNAKCYIGTDDCLYSNGSVVLTSANAVTLDTDQTITGSKTFNNNLTKMIGTYGGLCVYAGIANGEGFRFEPCDSTGTWKSNAITVWQTGNVAIGTTATNNYKLYINGSTYLGGSTFYNSGDATLKIYNANGTYTGETVALQSCIDGRDGETAESGTTYDPAGSVGYRMVIALQPRGGRVAIGKLIPSYTLDVNGTAFFGNDITVASGVRISQASGNLYLGSSSNSGWTLTQDIGSQDGNTYWSIRTDGDARFQHVGIAGYSTSYGLYCNSTGYFTGNVGIGVAPDTTYALKANGKGYFSDRVSVGPTTDANYRFFVDGTTYLNNTLKVGGALTADTSLSVGTTSTLTGNVTMSAQMTCSGNSFIGTATGSQVYIGTGTQTGSYRLYVAGIGQNNLGLYVNGASYINGNFTVNGQSTLNGLRIYENTNTQYITGYRLDGGTTDIIIYTGGNSWCRNGWQNYSDMRLKNKVSDIDISIGNIAAAPIFNFKWKDDDTHTHIGSSAQYWQSVLENSVCEARNGTLGMDYGPIALVAAVMEARTLEDHERRIKKLEAEIDRMDS